MSLSDLEAILKLVTDEVYEREAQAGATRYIVWHRYNFKSIEGDDRRLLDLDRVQLDVYWQQKSDTLLDDLMATLNYYRLPYDVQDITWDDDRALNRCIIQLTVV